MIKYLYIAAGGAAGTMCRYFVAGFAQRLVGSSFPIGTFTVNMAGCFLFGFVTSFFENRIGMTAELRLMLLTGFMGAFTTFSTYMFESVNLVKNGQWTLAALNMGGQTALGFMCIMLGLALGRLAFS
ncbi:fluoride efflux transporter CrcB [Maridesulfovibrio bastinii]|jgi:CrcB protein|uniref:fluoride efflux transporter CrcB n=1 Tax=Maridesulfovibrio bastinii TaxID=47157 RepID=UPI0003FCCD2D|nr:fluoride efflux transporter CrcB [Maridesulfovibrio bastinii]